MMRSYEFVERKSSAKTVKIDVIFAPSLLPADDELRGSLVIVIDVFRASATMCTLIQQGVDKIHLVSDVETAMSAWAALADNNSILLVGERQGLKPKGFHFGNSPTELRGSNLQGYRALYVTTNGTHMLQRSAAAEIQLVSSFVNLAATLSCVETILKSTSQISRLLLCCSGSSGSFSLEDSFFAGAFVSRYIAKGYGHELTDAAKAATCIVNSYNNDPLQLVHEAAHAQILLGHGFVSDIELCLTEDVFNCVPVCKGNIVTNFL